MSVPATDTEIAAAPKVLLHDHLDGGLRPQTLLELAAACGYRGLPASDADSLASWFAASASSGSLVRYLETFAHTVAVLQTDEALVRVAREAVVDLAADGVMYAELRMAPELVTEGGLSMDAAVEAMVEGLRAGERDVAAAGGGILAGLLVCALRDRDQVASAAAVAVRWHGDGVVGFDLAGPEDGYPASRHAEALRGLRDSGVPLTLHAGEGAGPQSVRDALGQGAVRLGHGVRSVEDPELVAELVARDVCLELCPTSNLQTGVVPDYPDHPFHRLDERGVRVTVNTDNRLMSRTTPSAELRHLRDAFGLTRDDVVRFARQAAEAAFLPDNGRSRLLARIAAADAAAS